MSVLASPRSLGRLFVSDAMNVGRDPTLIFATIFSIVPALAFRLGQAALDRAAEAAFGLAQASAYVAPFAVCLPAFMIGWVTGFLFLEDRDEGTLLALDVSPLGKSGFVAYRVGTTALLTVAVALAGARLVVPQAGWGTAGLLAALVAMEAVSAAFVLPAVARNKVEGLALTKLTNLAALAPLLAAIASPWRYFGGLVPSYWIGELLGISGRWYLPMPAVVLLALGVHAAMALVLYTLMVRRAG